MLRLIAIVALALCGLCTANSSTFAQSAECLEIGKDGKPLQPGDYGYMHKCLHEHFVEMYKTSKCHCHTGFCRPTLWRLNDKRETEVLIDRYWYTFDPKTLRERGVIPKALWPFPAIVCARPTGKSLPDGRPEQDVECTAVNSSG